MKRISLNASNHDLCHKQHVMKKCYKYPSLNVATALLVALLLAACSSQPQLPKLEVDAIILAFGDSLTYGSGVSEDESYPAVLSRLTGMAVINAGVPGEVTVAGLMRLPAILDEVEPQLMILCHGGNDMLHKENLTQTAENIRQMILMARQRGVSVLLLAVPRPGILLSPADFYEQVAEEMKIPIDSDVLPDVLADRSMKSDTIHPNSDGYRLMAEAVFQLMKDVGAY